MPTDFDGVEGRRRAKREAHVRAPLDAAEARRRARRQFTIKALMVAVAVAAVAAAIARDPMLLELSVGLIGVAFFALLLLVVPMALGALGFAAWAAAAWMIRPARRPDEGP